MATRPILTVDTFGGGGPGGGGSGGGGGAEVVGWRTRTTVIRGSGRLAKNQNIQQRELQVSTGTPQCLQSFPVSFSEGKKKKRVKSRERDLSQGTFINLLKPDMHLSHPTKCLTPGGQV